MIPLGSSRRNQWTVSARGASFVRPPLPSRPVHIPASPKPLTLDIARTAAVVIDMQNDFCTEGGWLHGIGVDVAPTHRAVAGLAAALPSLRAAGIPVIWLDWGNRPDRLNCRTARRCCRRIAGAQPPWRRCRPARTTCAWTSSA